MLWYAVDEGGGGGGDDAPPGSGEAVCQNHGYGEDECNAKGCCHFNDELNGGQCMSSVGQDPCDSTGGDGDDSDDSNDDDAVCDTQYRGAGYQYFECETCCEEWNNNGLNDDYAQCKTSCNDCEARCNPDGDCCEWHDDNSCRGPGNDGDCNFA